MKLKHLFSELIETFSVSLTVIMLIYWFVGLPETVYGASMEPTFYTGERILVEKVTKHFKEFERGDIVVLNPPGNEDSSYVKRIIGIPGDVFKILNCNVYIARAGDKFRLEEPYLYEGTCTAEGPLLKEGRSIQIKDNQYLVLGDNRMHSADSRVFGLIDSSKIQGEVVLRFWPFSKAQIY